MTTKLLGTLARYGWKSGVHKNEQYGDINPLRVSAGLGPDPLTKWAFFVVTPTETWGADTKADAQKLWAMMTQQESVMRPVKSFRQFIVELSPWHSITCPKCGDKINPPDFSCKCNEPVAEDGAGGGAGGGVGAGAGVAVNNAGSGNIAGLGVGKEGKPANWGEPGVDLRKRRRQDEGLQHTGGKFSVAHPEPDADPNTPNELDIWRKNHKQFEAQSDFDYSNDIISELVAEGVDLKHVETFAGAPVFEVDMDTIHKSRFGKNRYHRYSRYVGEDKVGEAIRQHGRSTRGDIILKDSKTAVMTYLRRKAPVQ